MGSLSDRLRAWVSPIVKPPLRRVRYRIADLVDRRRTRGSDQLLPPPSLRALNGPEEFLAMGRSIAGDVAAQTGLHPGADVLDAGCGSGRVALGLLDHIGPEGSYEGFDIVPEAVAWCQRRITAARPNFRFQVADVYNHHYHRKGGQQADHYRFPYDDGSFDVVLLTSIFTHLGAGATERYLRESARVLRPNGRLYASFFLIDEVAREAIAAGAADIGFVSMADGALTANPRDPDAAVAHDESTIRDVLASAGLEVRVDPLRGNWSGRDTTRRQDVIIAVKSGDTGAAAGSRR